MSKPKSVLPSRSARNGGGENAISIIGPGMRVEGDVSTEGTVRIEGSVRGTVRAEKAVVLGTQGNVEGEIHTQDAVIGGRLQGSLTAEGRLEVQGTSVIDGEIRARSKHLKLEEGARFNGNITMMEEEEAPPRASVTDDKVRGAVPEKPRELKPAESKKAAG